MLPKLRSRLEPTRLENDDVIGEQRERTKTVGTCNRVVKALDRPDDTRRIRNGCRTLGQR